eukprot:m.89160 g.89160  ORF g.89160 m.89160 type:complete len:142 (+) comp12883_c1_seq2:214-639(+)
MATAEWYCYAYQVCKEWAESLGSEVASASATELFQLLLGNDTHGAPVVQPCPGDADIDPTSYGLMVASLTELTSESPLASFRQEFGSIIGNAICSAYTCVRIFLKCYVKCCCIRMLNPCSLKQKPCVSRLSFPLAMMPSHY